MSIISLLAAYGVSNFKQGFCRDINAYPVLNDNKHFNNWNRSVISHIDFPDREGSRSETRLRR